MPKKVLPLPESWAPKTYPKKLGDLIDLGFDLREQRKVFEKVIEEIKQEEKRLEEHTSKAFTNEDLNGASGKRGKVEFVAKDLPQIDVENGGWEKFYAFVRKTGQFDLMHKRLGEAACKERWDNGEEIPGVKKFTQVTMKFTEKK